MLVERGVLDLDGAIDALLPELTGISVLRTPNGPVDDAVPLRRPITARHLLTFDCGAGISG